MLVKVKEKYLILSTDYGIRTRMTRMKILYPNP